MNGNTYFETCIPTSCVVAVIDKFGSFGVLVKEDTRVPGVGPLGDVWQIGPTGDRVARITEAEYQILIAAGLERKEIDPSDHMREIGKIDSYGAVGLSPR